MRRGLSGDTWRLAAPLVVLVASSFAFFQLTEDYVEGEWVVDVDHAVARWMREHSSAPLADVLEILTVAGSVPFLAAAMLVAASVIAVRRRLAAAVMLPLSFLGALILIAVLKRAFQRDRPPFSETEGFSFPSGHALLSAVVYGAIVVALVPELPSWRVRVPAVAAAVIVVSIVCFSRVYLGVHFLTDVLAGAAAGLAWLAVSVFAVAVLYRRGKVREPVL
jgi:membrane-associated phospholipid phosphatase